MTLGNVRDSLIPFKISYNQAIVTGLFGSLEITLMNFLTHSNYLVNANSRNKAISLSFSWDFRFRNRNSEFRIPTHLVLKTQPLCGLFPATLSFMKQLLLLTFHSSSPILLPYCKGIVSFACMLSSQLEN